MSGSTECVEPPAKRRYPTSSHCTECGQQLEAASATSIDETAPSIWLLNNDCLLSLLHHLPKSDLNNMRLTCTKMRGLVDSPEIEKRRKSDRMSLCFKHHKGGRVSGSRKLYLGQREKLEEEYSIDPSHCTGTTTVSRTTELSDNSTRRVEEIVRSPLNGVLGRRRVLPESTCSKLKEWMRWMTTVDLTFSEVHIDARFLTDLIGQFENEQIDQITLFGCTFADDLTEEDESRFRKWLHERRCSYFNCEAISGRRWRVIVTEQLLYLPYLRKFYLDEEMRMPLSEATVLERFGLMDTLCMDGTRVPRHLLPGIIETLVHKSGYALLTMKLTGDQWTPEELLGELGPRFAMARPEQEYDFEMTEDGEVIIAHPSTEMGIRCSDFADTRFLVIEAASVTRQ